VSSTLYTCKEKKRGKGITKKRGGEGRFFGFIEVYYKEDREPQDARLPGAESKNGGCGVRPQT